MVTLLEALRKVKAGQTKFEVPADDASKQAEIDEYGKALLFAEKKGLVGECLKKRVRSRAGQSRIHALICPTGLTHAGERFLERRSPGGRPRVPIPARKRESVQR